LSEDIYNELADALDKLPNGFPRTTSNVEIQILKKIFSPDEATLASQLTVNMESADSIAERFELSLEETEARLVRMSSSGLVWHAIQSGKHLFRLAPFIVGIYEAQLGIMDHEFAHLFDSYMAEGGAAGIMKPEPALHRVIPAYGTVRTEWIMPYDDVHDIITEYKTFHLRDCICRVQKSHTGYKCNFEMRTCLSFSSTEQPSNPYSISQKEALNLFDEFDEIGLVHTVSNVMNGVGYICNCCGCCCGILRGINEWGIETSVAHANYFATIDPDSCLSCGTCIKRCQVRAISEKDYVVTVNKERCIGCGLCVTGCPNTAVTLQKKPDSEIVNPPADFTVWQEQRSINRTKSR
jgi:electron transport complex protein RnfB